MSKVRILQPVAPAAILIYVLLVFAIMGTLLALMVTTFGANNRFAERAITDTRLRMENQSSIGKALGLYQSDPRHAQLGLLNTSRRSVTYLPYESKRSGYLALNKPDLITVDGRDYPDRNLIPTSVRVLNMPESLGSLSLIARVIRVDTDSIESSTTLRLAKPAGSTATETTFNLPADLTDGEQRFVRKWELVLYSDKDVLYEVIPNGSTQLVAGTMGIAATSRNSSIAGSNQVTSSNSATYAIRPSAAVLVSPDSLRNGSAGTAVLSSWNYPGISTAFIDPFDGWSSNDWTTSWDETASTHFSNGNLALNPTDTITATQAVTGDFDLRVTSAKGTLPTAPNTFVKATIGTKVHKIGVAMVNVFGVVGTSCVQTASNLASYYSGTTVPTTVSDGSAVCVSTYPDLYVPVDPAMTGYTLRFERKGNLINAFVCESNATNECDRADKFILINPTPSCVETGTPPSSCSAGGTTVFAIANSNASQPATVQSIRIAQVGSSPRTYVKTLAFEKAVKIKKVELLGYVPSSAALVAKLANATTGTCTSHCTAVNYGNQTRIIPSPALSTDKLTVDLSFASSSGDLSEIPFIYGIRVSYE